MENNIEALKVIDEFIENWKKDAIEYYTSELDKLLEEGKREYDYFKQKYGSNIGCIGIYSPKDQDRYYGYQSYKRSHYDRLVLEFLQWGVETAKEKIIDFCKREAVSKKRKFIARVNHYVGNIIKPISLKVGFKGDIDGIIQGEKGFCKINTIYAGGYNDGKIVNVNHGQCLHLRVLIKVIEK